MNYITTPKEDLEIYSKFISSHENFLKSLERMEEMRNELDDQTNFKD